MMPTGADGVLVELTPILLKPAHAIEAKPTFLKCRQESECSTTEVSSSFVGVSQVEELILELTVGGIIDVGCDGTNNFSRDPMAVGDIAAVESVGALEQQLCGPCGECAFASYQ